MRVPRRGAAVLAAALALAPAAGCSGAPPTPQATAEAYLAAFGGSVPQPRDAGSMGPSSLRS